MIRIRELSLQPSAGDSELRLAVAKTLHCERNAIENIELVKRSVDARKKNDIRIIYTVDVKLNVNERRTVNKLGNPKVTITEYHPYRIPIPDHIPEGRPIVVGFGPAGMFAALTLAEAGLKPIIIERGADADKRTREVESFWNGEPLNPCTNVQFGEGGAGMFSDGKLNTGISDIRIRYVLERLVGFGAENNILYDAKPHVGTDILRQVVINLRNYIISLGAEVMFETKMVDLDVKNGELDGIWILRNEDRQYLKCNAMILAPGHSARDTFRMLLGKPLSMEAKPFSMGVRIEHRQESINCSQYGPNADMRYLPPADYKINCKTENGGSAYTFCMCPGGYVVAAASEPERICTNGMSYSHRDGENANSALLVTLHPENFPYEGPLGGVRWQEEIEHNAFVKGGSDYHAPAQLVEDFLKHKPSCTVKSVKPTYRPGVTLCDLHDVLPNSITDTLELAIVGLDHCLHGFANGDAVLTAPETRSSSPVRIRRNDKLCSDITGLYPCGEGAGYAGGIMSAAVDGIKCAEALIGNL